MKLNIIISGGDKMEQIDIMNDNMIENTNRNEENVDMVLEVIYEKYQKLPKMVFIEREIKLLKGKKLKLVDELFLDHLIKAKSWLMRVTMIEYLDIWTLERHIPYERRITC
jgi:hypothetical protein